MKEIRKSRLLYTLLKVLLVEHDYITLKEIKTKVANLIKQGEFNWAIELKDKRIKNYLLEINEEFGALDTSRGRYGGYKLSDVAKESIRELMSLQLNEHEMNALNDSFEFAKKSQSFHYNLDLDSGKIKLYSKKDLKIDDCEYYIGIETYNKDASNTLKILKIAMMEQRMVEARFKHEHYGIKPGIYKLKPYFAIHDSDESFIVFKDDKGNIIQNLLNISKIKILDTKFKSKLKIEDFISDYGLKIKGTVGMKFITIDDRGRSILDLWNYEYEKISKVNDTHVIRFHEVYKAQEFLYRMMPHIKNLELSGVNKDKFIKEWNKKIHGKCSKFCVNWISHFELLLPMLYFYVITKRVQ